MTEDEQIEQFKQLWKKHGMPVLTGVLLALAIFFGWKAWQNYQARKAFQASSLYQTLLNEALNNPASQGKDKLAQLADVSSRLQKNYGNSHYVQYADLFVAKAAVDNGQLDEAAGALQRVLDKPADALVEELAQQRMARVLLAQNKAEEALKLLENEGMPSFQAIRQELKGDVLLKLGRSDDALTAYKKAEALDTDNLSSFLQMKIDDLAKGDA